jgi:ADP-heptose:LPS heptosyltransferase
VVWVIGEAEFDMPERAGDLPGSLILRSLPLPILVHVLSGSSAYIGNDSGISHLAGATGCGCVVLFGPSDEVVWAPRGKKVTILKAPRPCSPCHPFKNGIAHPCSNPCMRDISVEEVVDAVRRIIEQKNAVRG